MKRKELAETVKSCIQKRIDIGCDSNRFFVIPLTNYQHDFIFDLVVTNDNFLSYDYKNADVVNEDTEEIYPNVCHYLCNELDKLFGAVNRENQSEYFESLTGRALRQAKEEQDV